MAGLPGKEPGIQNVLALSKYGEISNHYSIVINPEECNTAINTSFSSLFSYFIIDNLTMTRVKISLMEKRLVCNILLNIKG